MSADNPAPTPVDAPAVDPSLDEVALEAKDNQVVIDAVSSGPDTEDKLLFGLTEVPEDIAEKLKAHPDAGAGLLGAMVDVEIRRYETSKGEESTEESKTGALATSESFDKDKALETLNELQGTGNDHQLQALYADEIAPGKWQNKVTGEEFSASDVADAREEWLKNPSKFAAGFWYEINRASSGQDFDLTLGKALNLINEAVSRPESSIAGGSVKFSPYDVEGILEGVGIAHEHGHVSAKYIKYSVNEEGLYEYNGIDAPKFIEELATKFKGYELAQLSSVDIETLEFFKRMAEDISGNPESDQYDKAQKLLQKIDLVLDAIRQNSATEVEEL